ncbi:MULTISPECIES: hypothetical protein [unclassified Thiocapsa]|uniref:hypothetical protein n=1 Tax=unclassified Thiocapsa TaxID=2641286 RepID=UPI0035B437B0
MTSEQNREGVLEALLERFERQRLPRILALKQQVDEGGKLRAGDIDFLTEVLADAQHNAHLISEVPHCKDLYSRVVHLYRDITEKALVNEQGV